MRKFLNSFMGSMKADTPWGQAGRDFSPMGSQISATGGSRNVWNTGGLYQTGGGMALGGLSTLGAQIPGGAGALAGGALGLASNMTDLFGFNPEVSSIGNTYSSQSAPGFDLSTHRLSTKDFVSNVRSDANKKVLGSMVSGAGAGAAFGPIGAGVGAAVGAIGGLFGKRAAVKKAKTAEEKMKSEYGSAIDTFNQAQESYYGRENAQERYMAMQQSRQAYGIPSNNPYLFL